MNGGKGYIQIKNVTKIFARNDLATTLTALSDVSIDIQPGEFVSIVGASGCGKSTLLRIIAGLETPTHGGAFCDGERIEEPSARRGLVFQDPTLFPWLNVWDNVAFGLKAEGKYQEKKESISKLLQLIGLEEFPKSYPHQLSGGMSQRVSLIRALANEPDVLLLDEPLGALDAFTRMNIQDELINLWKQRGTTMILITHDVDEAIYLSNRIIVMSPRPGRIMKELKLDMYHPRNRGASEFVDYRNQILKLLHFADEEVTEYYL